MKHLRFLVIVLVWMLLGSRVLAQRTTGAIEGTITDVSGAVIPGAHISAANDATGERREMDSDSSGMFRIVELPPGNYTVIVEAKGFKRVRFERVAVQIAAVTPLSVRLEVGKAHEQVTVNAVDRSQVDTVSTEVGSVITTQQIEQLAIVGRNVMDLAQLQSGVQLRDGGEIDVTKNNFTIAAFQGRAGRETQVEWDGLSVQDHNNGGPVVNISIDGIQEFQVAQATLSPAHSVASGGAVNIVGRSGGNDFHGSAFEFFRDKRLGAAIGPIKTPYDRNQFGARFGGPFVRNKLFFFTDFERNETRDSFVANPPHFSSLQGFFPKPFIETFMMGRVDWAFSPRWTAFSRYSYGFNDGVVGAPLLGGSRLDGARAKTQSRVFGGGVRFTGAKWTHDWRFGYNAYPQDLLPDIGLPTPLDSMGRPYNLKIDDGAILSIGPNTNTNQLERQKNYQFKYDAGYLTSHHWFQFGFDLTKWTVAGNFPVQVNGPELDSSSALSNSTNPLDFPLEFAVFANGLGFLSEKPALGFPHGGFFQWRPALYFHDTWQVFRNLNVNYGLRWLWMSDQFNPDLKRSPLLDQFIPGLSKNTHTPKTDFGPQLGFAWDPVGNGKTVIRSAAGLYFEELTFDSFYQDRGAFISSAIGLQFAFLAGGLPLLDPRTGQPFAAGDPLATSFGFPNGTSATELNPLFGQPIGSVSTAINNLNGLFQAASAQQAQNPSAPSSFDIFHELGFNIEGTTAFLPDTRNPRVFQFNIGVQRQLRRGLVASAEYVKVRGLRFPLIVDLNHVGEATVSSFDRNVAIAAIAATNASLGCPNDATSSSIDCAIRNGATIASYGANGLGAGPGSQGFAFRGRNPNFGLMDFFEPISTSNYNAINLRLEGKLGAVNWKPFSWMRGNNLTATYTLSRNTGMLRPTRNTGIADQTLNQLAWDNNRPRAFVGPTSLDRTHILNFASITEIKGGFRFSLITHWFSALSQNTLLPTSFSGCRGPSEIFCTDVTGDGTTGDLLPTAPRPGAFGRDLKGASGLNQAISAYNSQFASQPTPAGQLLVSQGLFTTAQLQALKGVMPTIPLAPAGQVGLDPVVLTDVRLSWHHKFWKERFEAETSVDAFNIFNRTHFDPPRNILAANLTGTIGHINGTTAGQRTNVRQRGSGTFEQGARRQFQLGLRISF